MTFAPCAMVAFRGFGVDAPTRELISDRRVAGVTLYRSLNIEAVEQTRRLISDLVSAARRPLLIGVDQEGGQLVAAGPETTHFPGNMAVGAAGSPELAYAVGRATGAELRALGINVNYAPVADVASRPGNPSLGIRAFGEDPVLVAEMTAATVRGLQASGAAATIKHFPGKGEAVVDPHFEFPVLDLTRARLDELEFAPFRAGIDAGARLVMVGHYGLPAVIGDRVTPASVAPSVLRGLIRDQIGFTGLVLTDALDMGGFRGFASAAPLAAGADLLLYGPAQTGQLPARCLSSSTRLDELLDWIGGFVTPDLDVVGSAAHRHLASELARRSITLVRDESALLPLRLAPEDRLLAIMPKPVDLTPADTSSFVRPGLAGALRSHHRATTEVVIDHEPSYEQISGAVQLARSHDALIIGTIDAGGGQAALIDELAKLGKRLIVAALRTPYDLSKFPTQPTYMCAYGIHEPSLSALADAIFGRRGITGHLPVSIPALYPIGHGIELRSA